MSARPEMTPQIDCDLLVIGSGAGGLSAALTAAWHGLKVIVAEKEPVFGGTRPGRAVGCGRRWIRSPCVPASLKTRRNRAITFATCLATTSTKPR